MINYLLENPDNFKRIIAAPYTFRDILKVCTEPAQILMINYLLENPAEFQRIIASPSIFQDILTVCTESAKDLMINHLLKNPAEFQRVITCNNVFVDFIKKFPKYKTILLEFLFKNPDAFKIIIKDKKNLNNIKDEYPSPSYSKIFDQPTVDKALEEAQKWILEKEGYKQRATIGALAKGEFSKSLPPEISSYIGGFLSIRDAVNLAKTTKKARQLAKNSADDANNETEFNAKKRKRT